MTCPVINFELSDAKNKIVCATSSQVPITPNGVCSFKSHIISTDIFLFICVSITPGATALTFILHGPTSFAKAFVKPMTAALVAE